jgi:hypothetical protein
MAESRPKWHIGFDCATKTFAFSLSYVDLDTFAVQRDELNSRARAIEEAARRSKEYLAAGDTIRAEKLLKTSLPAALQMRDELRSFIRIIDGETKDLFPGRSDKSISTTERIRAVAQYINSRVKPAITTIDRGQPAERLRIVVEFQSINALTQIVAHTIVALFADNDLIIVDPSLKNSVHTCEAGRYGLFAERYASRYAANKAHAKFNFNHIESCFGTGISSTTPALRGHIADSFMQVVGYLVNGPSEKIIASLY